MKARSAGALARHRFTQESAMNINNVYGNIATAPTAAAAAITQAPVPTSSVASGSGPASTTTLSTPGQLYGQLQQLSQQDPATFKAVAAQLATHFQNAASQATGPQAQFLTQLASQFTQAAQTGTLQPPQSAQGVNAAGGGHHHHHHHGGGGGGAVAAIAGSPSGDVNQAYESALSIVAQATGASASSGPGVALGDF
jgi:hypothetical protein